MRKVYKIISLVLIAAVLVSTGIFCTTGVQAAPYSGRLTGVNWLASKQATMLFMEFGQGL
jgi:hypothetical protein